MREQVAMSVKVPYSTLTPVYHERAREWKHLRLQPDIVSILSERDLVRPGPQ